MVQGKKIISAERSDAEILLEGYFFIGEEKYEIMGKMYYFICRRKIILLLLEQVRLFLNENKAHKWHVFDHSVIITFNGQKKQRI